MWRLSRIDPKVLGRVNQVRMILSADVVEAPGSLVVFRAVKDESRSSTR